MPRRCWYSQKIRLFHGIPQPGDYVLASGCFDLLHYGHMRFLNDVKGRWPEKQLVVAVLDDVCVQEMKGLWRPVIPCEQRMEMVAMLGCVDWVYPQHQRWPDYVIERLKPKIYVKGGDYQPQEIPEAKVVAAVGAELVIMPYHKGWSTTSIIQAIRGGKG